MTANSIIISPSMMLLPVRTALSVTVSLLPVEAGGVVVEHPYMASTEKPSSLGLLDTSGQPLKQPMIQGKLPGR